jgi:N-acylglucosamine 2-epimerase
VLSAQTIMTELNVSKLLLFYEEQLFRDILPFWLKNGIDKEYGGYFTCFTNTGEELVSDDKYVWSQGRFIWVLSRLAALEGGKGEYLGLARSGVRFLQENALLENGTCAFLLDRRGGPKEPSPGSGYDTSFYADCFVILGFAEYARVSGERAALNFALRVYDSVVRRLQAKKIRTEPYPIPKGLKTHGVPMIMINTCDELSKALDEFGHLRTHEVKEMSLHYTQEILSDFVTGDDLILEMVREDGEKLDSILGTYINPGHTIEDMWFITHCAQRCGDSELIKRAARIVKRTMEVGWDRKYGGLLLFVNIDGGEPQGDTRGFEDDEMVRKLKNDWDNKLWWPHSEALYSTLLSYSLTKDKGLAELYNEVHDYTFATFPNPDKQVGEWIQIRDRQGKPVTKVVALPVKDPFHIARSFMLIIELLRGAR